MTEQPNAYCCDKCGKGFAQKGGYTKHLNRKTPCTSAIQLENTVTYTHINPQTQVQVKPLLKWVGGKTQIIDKVLSDFPAVICDYCEPFLGGGSVLLALLSYIRVGKISVSGTIRACDLNAPLIGLYQNIQNAHDELYDAIQAIIAEFDEAAVTHASVNRNPKTIEEAKCARENYYYWTRAKYNKLSPSDKTEIAGSAMFLFMNKTCFRGVFRMGPNGFNVPYGHYPNPGIIDRAHLDEVHALIQGVVFECCDFETALSQTNVSDTNDFVYLDPPYAPESDKSFVGYTECGFGIDDHTRLFTRINELTESGVKCMMSNADVALVRERFPVDKYNIAGILCKRSINSKNPGEKAKEVIIRNY